MIEKLTVYFRKKIIFLKIIAEVIYG